MRSVHAAKKVGVALMSAWFLASCSPIDDAIEVSSSALVVNQANTFGFEDNTAPRGADFDYNDMAMKLGIGEWFV